MTALTTKSLAALLAERAELVARCEGLIKAISIRPGSFTYMKDSTDASKALVLDALELSIARIDREIASLGDIQDTPSPQDAREWTQPETASAATHQLSCGCANELCTRLNA